MIFLSIDAYAYETLKDSYNDKYEYILPEVVFDKNIYQDKLLGVLDLQSNFKINNYDTNKTSKFLINDFDWESKDFNFDNGLNSKFIGKLKNINYETKNISSYKQDQTSEFFGAIGYLSEIELIKKNSRTNSQSLLTPKLLLRYAPEHNAKRKLWRANDACRCFFIR